MTTIKDSKICIVGGAGFVGVNLIQALLNECPNEILVIDNLLSSEKENLPLHPSIKFVEGSITQDSILKQIPEDVSTIFHLATFHGNQNSMADPLADHENNTLTSLKLFHHLSTFKNLKKVVYASAGCTVAEKTYDEAQATSEEAPVSLYHDTPYQISKIIGEFYANYYWKQNNLPIVKARFQNVYGPGEILGAGQWRGTVSTIWRNVIPTFIYKALQNEILKIDAGGEVTRDFIYSTDIAQGLIACATKGEPGQVYNLASGQETSILELAQMIIVLTSSNSQLDIGPKRSWDHSGRRFGSTEKSKNKLDFHAQTSLEDGLKRTIEWTRHNLSLIKKNILKHTNFFENS